MKALYLESQLMSRFYSSQSTVYGSCLDAAHAFREILLRISREGKSVIRVLEVGCGTGMLTECLSKVMKEFSDLFIVYDVTDISLSLAKVGVDMNREH